MCTLIVGRGVLGPGSVVLAANRDEDPARPSDPPGRLSRDPRVVGGRDRVAGGTWLAVRERRAAVAMLNRRDPRGPSSPTSALRSRGLLAIVVASVAVPPAAKTSELSDAALELALASARSSEVAAFSLAFLSPDSCWLLAHEPEVRTRVTEIAPGWHALTHADLDDRSEPRTAWLLESLAAFAPRSIDEAERGLIERLATHANSDEARGAPHPAVCIHEGRMVTVSSSVVCLTRDEARYRHGEGRPCEHPPSEITAALEGPLASEVSA